ncbi:MAG TPA: alanine racemase [Casimicrobiaceae bacterium]|jgi:alanine racemase|nr:alanine racemase [Casimicrobiaceae bacterium]
MARPLVAQIDLAALGANVDRVRTFAPGARVLAVVKADAYGHGLARVRPALRAADGLALIEIDKAVRLRETGEERPILLLEGFFDAAELPTLAEHRLATVVHTTEQVEMLDGARLSRPLDVWLKINTGMNRLGIAPADVHKVTSRLARAPAVASLHLMMHFARSEEPQGLVEPLARFDAACEGLPYPRSLANSAAVVRYGEVGGHAVRPGIVIYGATPFADRTAAELGLAPVMTLRSKLIGVQALAAGESVGYGATFTATRPTRIGVVACGYADGYPRHAPNGTPVLVDGRRVPMAGRASMDMITVDISSLPDARVGSDVVLWGKGLPVDEVARFAGTVGYELLCAVAPRVPFVVEGGEASCTSS